MKIYSCKLNVKRTEHTWREARVIVCPTQSKPVLANSGVDKSKVRWSGLRGRFLLLVLAIYLLVATVAALGFYRFTERAVFQLGTGYATQYARQQQARILAKLEREVVLAEKLVDSPLLKAWAKNEKDPGLRKQALQELDSFRHLFGDRSYFFIIDQSKNYYFNNAQDEFRNQELRYVVRRDDPRSNWYFDTIANVDNFALHVDNSPQLGLTKVWINAVVKDGQSKIGLGGSGLDLTEFLKDVVESKDAGVRTVLINRDGTIQAHYDSKLMQKNAGIKDETKRQKIYELLDPSQRTLLEQKVGALTSSSSGIDHFELELDGHQVIVGAAYMPDVDWLALVFVDPNQVIEFRQFLPILAVLGLALLISLLLISYAMDRLILRRLSRLTTSTQEIAAGQYDVHLRTNSNDELGQLTRSFNHMTATVRDYTHNLELKVEERTEELRLANEKVMDSIHYALLIQSALLAKPSELTANFSESFAYWRPRDVVGGDYYTLYTAPNGSYLLAVADCTGHGVPGAFMSMASKALLDRAVASRGLDDPADLLVELNTTLQDLLQQEEPGSQNGLDIGVLYGKAGDSRIRYAGARIPLWIQRPGQPLEVVKPDKCSLGYAKSETELSITNHDFDLPKGTRLFLLSDGLLDQPGGAKGFGLGPKRLQEAFLQWENVPLSAMNDQLDKLITEYSGTVAQRDDITVVGVSL